MSWDLDWEEEKIHKTKKLKIDNIIKKQISRVNEIGIPKDGEQIRVITNQTINFWSLIERFLEKRVIIDELYISVYRINKTTIDKLVDSIKRGSIKHAEVLVCSFFKNVNESWYTYLIDELQCLDNCIVGTFNIHTKISAFKSDDDHYVFEGSGNLSDNAKVEQYLFEQNKEMYEFHRDWIKELTNKDKTEINNA